MGKGCLMEMRPVGYEEYQRYRAEKGVVEVEGYRIRLDPIRVTRLYPRPSELSDTSTTVWSFPRRGSWATHRGDYRGNWPPQLVRAIILAYTRPGDTVLDPMVGSGTTCIEAKLLGRHCIGVDLSYGAVMLTLHRLYWLEEALSDQHLRKGLEAHLESLRGQHGETVPTLDDVDRAGVIVYHGDARRLDALGTGSVDLVAMHPPYYNIIRYSRGRKGRGTPGDLSASHSLENYLEGLGEAVAEAVRALKPGHYLATLIGDTRSRKHYVPITHHVLDILLSQGLILREEVVKIQHRMKATRERWLRRRRDFLLIYHEKLYILRKPASPREHTLYRYSSRL